MDRPLLLGNAAKTVSKTILPQLAIIFLLPKSNRRRQHADTVGVFVEQDHLSARQVFSNQPVIRGEPSSPQPLPLFSCGLFPVQHIGHLQS